MLQHCRESNAQSPRLPLSPLRPACRLETPARCPAAARSLLRTRSGLCRFRLGLQLGASIHSARGNAANADPGCADIFCSPISLYNINHCPLSYKLPSLPQASTTVPPHPAPAPARAPCPTVWRGQARAPSPRGETLASLRSTQSQQLSRSNASRSPPSCSPSTSSYSPPVRVRYTASSVLLGSSFTKHFGSVQAAHLVQHV